MTADDLKQIPDELVGNAANPAALQALMKTLTEDRYTHLIVVRGLSRSCRILLNVGRTARSVPPGAVPLPEPMDAGQLAFDFEQSGGSFRYGQEPANCKAKKGWEVRRVDITGARSAVMVLGAWIPCGEIS